MDRPRSQTLLKPPQPDIRRGADGYPLHPPARVAIAHLGDFLRERRLEIVHSYWAGNDLIVEVAAPAAATADFVEF